MNLNIVSKYRNEIYGFAILWVVVFHGTAINSIDYSFGNPVLMPLQSFLSVGNVGVDIFLFMSGICLYYSFVKNNDLYQFSKKRLLRIIPPVVLVYGIYWIIRYGVIAGDSAGLISRFLLLRFWLTGAQTVYYASLVLLLYFLYPYIYNCLFSGRHSGLRMAILMLVAYSTVIVISLVAPKWYSLTEIALTRIPVFIFGSYFGKMVYEGKVVNRYIGLLAIAGSLAFLVLINLGILHGSAKRFFYLFGGVSLSYTLAIILHVIASHGIKGEGAVRRALSFAGTISFELYLAHIMCNQVLRLLPIYKEGDLAQYAVVAMIALLVAIISGKLSTKIRDKAMSAI